MTDVDFWFDKRLINPRLVQFIFPTNSWFWSFDGYWKL